MKTMTTAVFSTHDTLVFQVVRSPEFENPPVFDTITSAGGAVNLIPSTAQRRRWFEIVISSRDALKTYLQIWTFWTFDKLLQYCVSQQISIAVRSIPDQLSTHVRLMSVEFSIISVGFRSNFWPISNFIWTPLRRTMTTWSTTSPRWQAI